MMSKTICVANYSDGVIAHSYQVEKEINDQKINIILYDIREGQHVEVAHSRITYKNIGEEYVSTFLSWYNLFFCSNNYGPVPDYEYMNRSVQEHKKTAATVYVKHDSDEAKAIRDNLPKECRVLPYGRSMIYVYHKGRLSDYFDFHKIRSIYEKHGVYQVNWDSVENYFQKSLSFFGNEKQCGFSLQGGGDREQMIVTGLILGYPIESTVHFLGYKVFE